MSAEREREREGGREGEREGGREEGGEVGRYSLCVQDHDEGEEEDEKGISLQQIEVPHGTDHTQPTGGGKQTPELK